MASTGRLVKRLRIPQGGQFVAPQVLRVDGISGVEREVFGPVLHVATFQAQELEQVVQDINERGYGLTFGLHTRIDDRVQRVVDRIKAGNVYVNRNQIGAIVGSQPFGGEGLSGPGPRPAARITCRA
jgi:RHH-type proline utilization regulon transcriptional repressor/proline dehydrogenase/delta 1-pyrroline-5-carboxylate dehydrogenase